MLAKKAPFSRGSGDTGGAYCDRVADHSWRGRRDGHEIKAIRPQSRNRAAGIYRANISTNECTRLTWMVRLPWRAAPCVMLAGMANQKQVDILAKGAEAWNSWRKEHHEIQPDLRGMQLTAAGLWEANLRGAKLSGAYLPYGHFREADLSDADLRGANLSHAFMGDANLSRADLSGADLSSTLLESANLKAALLNGASLVGAHMEGASLSSAKLHLADLNNADLTDSHLYGTELNGANLRSARLGGANLTGATAVSTIFCDVDLRYVRGLDMVKHEGPSSIGLDTIYRSQGKIPESFLRGAGVPDAFITYMKSLTGAAFEFYSCFISYSTNDQVFADRLYADLQTKGVRCWFAPHDIQAGRKIYEQIDEAIKVYDKLLLIAALCTGIEPDLPA